MKIIGYDKNLHFIDISEEEVDEVYNYVNLDDLDIEVFEGVNVLEYKSIESIYESMSGLQYHNKVTFGIVQTLNQIVNL